MTSVIRLVQNTKNPRGERSGAAAYARAVRRYDLDTPTFVGVKGVVRAKTGSSETDHHVVPAESVQNDLEYVVPVTVGNPGAELLLDFDTGSSDMWVWSSELKVSSTTLSGHNIYDPKASSTASKIPGATWKIRYGDESSASGEVWNDTVKIGDLVIKEQGVEVAMQLSDSFLQGEGSDGLLGLAWPQINTVKPHKVKTPVQNLIEQGTIEKGIFTVLLNKGAEGFYSFGTTPFELAGVGEPDVKYTPVDNSIGHWMYESTKATVGDKTINLPGNKAIADTGTTLCLVSDSVVDAIYGQIKGAKVDFQYGGWMYPKDAVIPKIQLAFGEHMITLTAENFGYGPPTGQGMVFGGVQSRGAKIPFDILGDIFLKNVYVIFDVANVRIGMAQRG